MNRNKKNERSIEDKILSQDRWMVFLILLGMAAICITILEVHEINTQVQQLEESKNLTEL